MPLTTTATWPSLVEGKKAKASEVESKFDWLEGTQYPMINGQLTTGVYDIGSATYQWRHGYFSNGIVVNGYTITTANINPQAWISIYNQGGILTIGSSYNISSMVAINSNTTRVVFTRPFTNAYYSAVGLGDGFINTGSFSTASFVFQNWNATSGVAAIPNRLGLICVGDW